MKMEKWELIYFWVLGIISSGVLLLLNSKMQLKTIYNFIPILLLITLIYATYDFLKR